MWCFMVGGGSWVCEEMRHLISTKFDITIFCDSMQEKNMDTGDRRKFGIVGFIFYTFHIIWNRFDMIFRDDVIQVY